MRIDPDALEYSPAAEDGSVQVSYNAQAGEIQLALSRPGDELPVYVTLPTATAWALCLQLGEAVIRCTGADPSGLLAMVGGLAQGTPANGADKPTDEPTDEPDGGV